MPICLDIVAQQLELVNSGIVRLFLAFERFFKDVGDELSPEGR